MRRGASLLGLAGIGVSILLSGCAGDQQPPKPGRTVQAAEPAGPASSVPRSTNTPGNTGKPSAKQGASADAKVAWMDNFCVQYGKVSTLADIQRPNVAQGDVAGAKKAFSGILTQFANKMSGIIDGYNSLPPSPLPAGDTAKEQIVGIYTKMHGDVIAARDGLNAAAPQDQQAMLKASQSLSVLAASQQELGKAITALRDSELGKAAAKAPACKNFAG